MTSSSTNDVSGLGVRWRASTFAGCALAAWLVGCGTPGIAVYRDDAGSADAAPLPACTDMPPAPADRAPGKLSVMLATLEVSALVADERELFVSAVFESKRGVYGVPKGGGAPRLVAPKLFGSLDSDGPWLYGDGARIEKATGAMLSYGNDLRHIGHDATSVFFLRLGSELVRANKDGSGGLDVLASGLGFAGPPVVRGEHVYWVASINVAFQPRVDALFRVPTRGGEVEKVVRNGLGDAIAVDCNYVHVTADSAPTYNSTSRDLARMKLGGGPIVPYAVAPPMGALFLDAVSAYAVSDHQITRVSLATGAVDVVKGAYSGRVFAMGDDAVYWNGPEGVVRAPK